MTNANYQKYLAIWTAHYSQSKFAGTCAETAAAYAATDCMNVCKGWPQSEIDDDLSYWAEKVVANGKTKPAMPTDCAPSGK